MYVQAQVCALVEIRQSALRPRCIQAPVWQLGAEVERFYYYFERFYFNVKIQIKSIRKNNTLTDVTFIIRAECKVKMYSGTCTVGRRMGAQIASGSSGLGVR